MAFEVEQDGDRLLVFPTLVYGDPPRARVDGSALVHLGGALPIRDEDAERQLDAPPARRAQPRAGPARRAHGPRGVRDAERARARGCAPTRAPRTRRRRSRSTRRSSIDGAKLDVELAGGGRTASVGAALRAWQAGVDLVPLDGGGWGRVPMAWFDQHGERVADLLAARGDDHRVPMYALPDLARLCDELDEPPPPELERLRPLLDGFAGIPAAAPSAGFVGELRPLPAARRRLARVLPRRRARRVLADDMGLGKTLQALAAVARQRTLVVVADERAVQLGRRDRAVPARPRASRPTTARAARSIRPPTSC